MSFNDRPGDSKPQSAASTPSVTRRFGAVEAVKNALKVCFRDTRPLIGDGEDQPAFGSTL
jgi:hypothetical protein